jgi:erythromycin esterase
MKTGPIVDLFEWLQSFNASRPPGDRVHVYGFDTTVIEHATNGLRSYLERVEAAVDESVLADLDTTTTGYGSDGERRAVIESARRVHSTLKPMLDANESAWVSADSRRAYEAVGHRLRLVDRQIEAHRRDHEGRLALRDETMAESVEWIDSRSAGRVALWGHNGHLNRGRHVLDGAGWDVDVPSMGEWLADSYGDRYCPVGFELGGGVVSALDGETGNVVEYSVPAPPSGSIPDVFRQVDRPLFCLSVDDLRSAAPTQEWLRSRPRRHDIWGGHPHGDSPVHYRPSDLGEFDWFVFVRETSPLVHLD